MDKTKQIAIELRKFLSQNNELSKLQQQKIFDYLAEQRLNILVVGATGAGKSSTINALFDIRNAVVGTGSEPLTMDVARYDLGNLILWDTPGLGDGVERDKLHQQKIIHHLNLKDDDDNYLIDLILVVLDGSSREMSTSYELINDIVIPNVGHSPETRIIVAINQADVAYKGPGGWDYNSNSPTKSGYKFLDEKTTSVRNRIKESTGVDVNPMYYSAGYQGDDDIRPPFNLSKLLYMIVNNAPPEKRLVLREKISKKKDAWQLSDGRKNYTKKTRDRFSFGAILGIAKLFLGLF